MKNIVRFEVLNAEHLTAEAVLHEGRSCDELAGKLYKLAKKAGRNRFSLSKIRFDGLECGQNVVKYVYVSSIK